ASSGSGGDPHADCTTVIDPGDDDQKAVQTAFSDAADGDIICLTAGTFELTAELDLAQTNVTVRGDGQDKTILDFMKSNTGGNGINIMSDGVTFEDFQVLDTASDGIRATDVVGVTFRRMTVAWTAEEDVLNGAYGLYPVGSDMVTIDSCIVHGARDA